MQGGLEWELEQPGAQASCWRTPSICQAPTAEHKVDKISPSQISISFLTSSRGEDVSMCPELQSWFWLEAAQLLFQRKLPGLWSWEKNSAGKGFRLLKDQKSSQLLQLLKKSNNNNKKGRKGATFSKNLWSVVLAPSICLLYPSWHWAEFRC